MDIFATLQIATDHYKILPPMVGEKIYVEDQGCYFTYDGEEWVASEG